MSATVASARPEAPSVILAPRLQRAGPFVFVAGVSSRGGGDIRSQTTAAIEALGAALEEVGGALENMVEITVYLVNMGDFAGYNDAYSAFFSSDGPARTTVAVERLSRPDQLIELRGSAYIVTTSSTK